nr:hypothetical protein [Spirochaetota bacterium]
WRSGKRHGRGTHIAPNGSEYCGTFADDRPAGEGVYLGIDGRRRRVTIRDNKMVPTLRLENEKPEDGCQYGEVDYKGRYHGWYRGRKFDAFKPHGFGAMTWPNGATFTGQWVDGKIHGRGAMVWENGARYSGQWRNGKRDGRGSFTWPKGASYVGEWRDNNRHGRGTHTDEDGTVRAGRWKEDAYLGK